jgi:hypothetical protein
MTKKINAQITATYDLDEIRNTLAELNGVDESEIKDHEINAVIYSYISDDFGTLADSVYLLDENGEQVSL